MDAVKGMPFAYVSVPTRVHEHGGGYNAHDTMSGAGEISAAPIAATPVNSWHQLSTARTGELTISFEGEVHVFAAVTPEKFQCVGYSNFYRAGDVRGVD